MKKGFLFSLVLFCSLYSFPSFSQCTHAIPSDAHVIHSTGNPVVDGGFTPQWICDGDTLTTTGGIFKAFLEEGAVMNIDGGADTIYVKDWATLNMSAGNNYIFYEPNAILNITGGNVLSLVQCPVIQFDYTNAPANRCTIVTALEEEVVENSFTLAPNPTTGVFTLHSTVQNAAMQIRVCNSMGETVYETGNPSISEGIDLRAHPKGVYLVKISTLGRETTKKLVVQ